MDLSIREHKEIINLLGGGKKLTARLKVLSNENINEPIEFNPESDVLLFLTDANLLS